MTRVIINGSKGRMGQALLACAPDHSDVQVVAEVDVGDDLTEAARRGDVIIDFSFHESTPQVAELCARLNLALVLGTTGHSAEEKHRIVTAGQSIPMVWASNFSTGVNALFWLTRRAAQILGPTFDVEVVEMHHRRKKDAPSGTAETLGELLAEARKAAWPEAARHGRQGIVGERSREEIGMHSLRGGDVVGDHTVMFATDGERLELTHKASSRDTFAHGALRAATWVCGRPAGIYSMQDVLGLT